MIDISHSNQDEGGIPHMIELADDRPQSLDESSRRPVIRQERDWATLIGGACLVAWVVLVVIALAAAFFGRAVQ